MKYIFRNIYLFIKNEKLVFLFAFLSIFSSALLLHFSYALYQSYMVQRESASGEQDWISVSITDDYEIYDEDEEAGEYKIRRKEGKDYLTVGMVKKALENLPEIYQKNLVNVNLEAYLADHFLDFNFNVEDNQIVPSEFFFNNSKNLGSWGGGRYFSEEEYKKGMPVAFTAERQSEAVPSYTESITSPDGQYLTIDGKQYRIIGIHKFPDLPVVPLTAVDEDTPVPEYIEFTFNHPVTSVEYEELKEWTEIYLGEHGEVREPELPDVDTIYMYNTMILVAVLISVISALNFAIMYRYILQKRKEEIRILRVCGLSKLRGVLMYVVECLFMTVPVYVMAVVFFGKVFLSYVNRQFSYISKSYPFKVYLVLFLLYYVSSIAILFGMIMYNMSHDEKMQIGGGEE
ncbi:MAG: ABC transporter permease [Lachnospiraceae bacterium]|nr:ABC transporter permease [Lachnospiraceae bacterium]